MSDHVASWPVKVGGMFRCCIEHCERTDPVHAGFITTCPNCGAVLTFDAKPYAWCFHADVQGEVKVDG